MSTISEFAKGLKERLRADDYRLVNPGYDGETWSDPATIDWKELDAAIDAFCAEFKAKRDEPK